MINADLLRQWAAQAMSMRPYPNEMFPPSPYYRFFEVLARNVKPSLSVVLGVCGGGDCLHLAKGWPEGVVVGIDYADDHPEHIKYIEDNFPNFYYRVGDSVELAEQMKQPVDILFIDTLHTYEQTMKEYNAWLPHLSDKAVICLDDLFRKEGMGQAWAEMPEPKLRLDTLHDGAECGGGFGVVWKS